MSATLGTICEDLAAEHAALDALVADLSAAAWEVATPAEGWVVRDQIAHLAFFDEVAALATVDAERFAQEVTEALAGVPAYEARWLARGRALAPPALLVWWRAARGALLAAAERLEPKAQVPWYGLPMSPVSFLTARLMETWSHGQDVVDALGLTREATDRLRHVTFLGVRTRGYSYAVRGIEPPTVPVGVELVLPSGAPWVHRPEGARDRISGPAEDFCLVVTQRRHVADTRLTVEGPAAVEWMQIAQAFAGPPGRGRRPGQFPIRDR